MTGCRAIQWQVTVNAARAVDPETAVHLCMTTYTVVDRIIVAATCPVFCEVAYELVDISKVQLVCFCGMAPWIVEYYGGET